MTQTNKKDGESDRITSVIPIVTTSLMEPAYNVLACASFVFLLVLALNFIYSSPRTLINTTRTEIRRRPFTISQLDSALRIRSL